MGYKNRMMRIRRKKIREGKERLRKKRVAGKEDLDKYLS